MVINVEEALVVQFLTHCLLATRFVAMSPAWFRTCSTRPRTPSRLPQRLTIPFRRVPTSSWISMGAFFPLGIPDHSAENVAIMMRVVSVLRHGMGLSVRSHGSPACCSCGDRNAGRNGPDTPDHWARTIGAGADSSAARMASKCRLLVSCVATNIRRLCPERTFLATVLVRFEIRCCCPGCPSCQLLGPIAPSYGSSIITSMPAPGRSIESCGQPPALMLQSSGAEAYARRLDADQLLP